jgi:uncharacterized RDD family membrane protein YckC
MNSFLFLSRRALAFLVDYSLVVAAVYFGRVNLIPKLAPQLTPYIGTRAAAFIAFLLLLFYFFLIEAKSGSGSIGKIMFKLRVNYPGQVESRFKTRLIGGIGASALLIYDFSHIAFFEKLFMGWVLVNAFVAIKSKTQQGLADLVANSHLYLSDSIALTTSLPPRKKSFEYLAWFAVFAIAALGQVAFPEALTPIVTEFIKSHWDPTIFEKIF